MTRRLHLLVLTLLLALAAPVASASTVIRVGLEQMTRSSTVVVHGVVTSSRVEAIHGNERHLRTIVDVRVSELLRGPKEMTTLRLELMGGRLGKWAMMIPGMPSFKDGEEVVLFLEKTATNWALTGLAQGKYAVTTGADGVKRVKRNLDGIHFVTLDEKGRMAPVDTHTVEREQTLDAFLAEVRRLAKQP